MRTSVAFQSDAGRPLVTGHFTSHLVIHCPGWYRRGVSSIQKKKIHGISEMRGERSSIEQRRQIWSADHPMLPYQTLTTTEDGVTCPSLLPTVLCVVWIVEKRNVRWMSITSYAQTFVWNLCDSSFVIIRQDATRWRCRNPKVLWTKVEWYRVSCCRYPLYPLPSPSVWYRTGRILQWL